jgi:hypothetical protein
MRFRLTGYRSDMGDFSQPGCKSVEDALWHLNKMREHDNLPALTIVDMNIMLRARNTTGNYAELVRERD